MDPQTLSLKVLPQRRSFLLRTWRGFCRKFSALRRSDLRKPAVGFAKSWGLVLGLKAGLQTLSQTLNGPKPTPLAAAWSPSARLGGSGLVRC